MFEDRTKKQIVDREELHFASFSAFHLITIAARTKDKRQISPEALRYERLTIEIDGKRYAASFQGNTLHNSLQTIYIVTFLRGTDHTVKLVADAKQKTATLESLSVSVMDMAEMLTLPLHAQAEEGNGRPWMTFILNMLPLASFTSTITYSRRKRDSDDVKIIIDGTIQKNLFKTIKFLFWRLAGSLLPLKTSTKTETETFTANFPKGLHMIAFEADRTPTFETIAFDFGTKPEPPTGLPTVDDPAWTGDFADDSEEMLLTRAIYGETGGEMQEAKIAVGWAIRNRLESKKWGKTYHEVILYPLQFEPFTDHHSSTFSKISNPQLNNPIEKEAWKKSYDAAKQIISDSVPDPTTGANHFYSTIQPPPLWADETRFTIQIGKTRFYKL